MNYCILALGSRGDVQPFIALALGLQTEGHQVVIAAAHDYRSLVESYGCRFAPLVGSISALLNPEQMAAGLAAGRSAIIKQFLQQTPPIIRQLIADALAACQTADCLIVSSLGMWPALHLAEHLHIPVVLVHLHPYAASSQTAHHFAPQLAWASYRRMSYRVAEQLQWQVLRMAFNQARQQILQRPSLSIGQLWQRSRNFQPPTLYAYSALVAPPPATWFDDGAITGYWSLPPAADWQAPTALQQFLAAGPAPITISFGSMLHGQKRGNQLSQLLITASQKAKVRMIINQGWGDLAQGKLPANCLAINGLAYAWLFERVAAVVHHGGAGVTATALGAGKPALVTPFLGDQYFWGQRVYDLKAGPAPVPANQLQVAQLATLLCSLIERDDYQAAAQQLATQLAQEQGVTKAIAWLKQRF
ncbi:MAG TPA: glycosyltransferase [Herpetosiphon sp.]|uniref:Sterol 3-beta-glucosyltransferase n=1 Tax=Herpetosiphon aurantiacus (strain ATCC 23779 / DSM 785 / 114-95) TaxID=316274 RepID=A9AUA5_HERA2|nr:glycosyltransferase [Herpetosiphon sp.]ABX03024.1 Sterol 3-beta-glucosyltransferase [Herpetosiphon aurantiacus DSM 785]HBW50873.1 glycosyltransferase [Herpetosiphon sp.]